MDRSSVLGEGGMAWYERGQGVQRVKRQDPAYLQLVSELSGVWMGALLWGI